MPPWISPVRRPSRAIGVPGLAGRLDTVARRRAIDPVGLAVLDGLARSGEVVLLLGSGVEVVRTAYLDVVAAGVDFPCIVHPGLMSLDDLWRDPTTGTLSGLAHAWEAAQTWPEHAAVVTIRSLDAAPCHLWMSDLVALLSGPARPRNLIVFATTTGFTDTARLPAGIERFLTPLDVPYAESAALAAWHTAAHPNGRAKGEESTELVGRDAFEIRPVDHDTAELLGEGVRDVEAIRRVARFLGVVIGPADSKLDWVEDWLRYLVDEVASDEMPEALRAGYRSLERLQNNG